MRAYPFNSSYIESKRGIGVLVLLAEFLYGEQVEGEHHI